eukprot:COSAG02_NODE_6936_length_3279_cov_21.396388_4_plen_106_part_00
MKYWLDLTSSRFAHLPCTTRNVQPSSCSSSSSSPGARSISISPPSSADFVLSLNGRRLANALQQLLEQVGSPIESEGVPTTTAVIADCGMFEGVLEAEPEPESEQ